MGAIFTVDLGTGLTTVAFVIINTDGQWWNTGGTPAFETYAAGNIADYGTAAGSEYGSTGLYPCTFPALITTRGYYKAYVVVKAGASLAVTDFPLDAEGMINWDGSAIIGPGQTVNIASETTVESS